MRKKNYKGRCVKIQIPKCKGVCKTYSDIQYSYALKLSENAEVSSFRCNVLLEGLDYTSDFVCVMTNGDVMVRECVFRKQLTKPLTVKLLKKKKNYWERRGVKLWGIVIEC